MINNMKVVFSGFYNPDTIAKFKDALNEAEKVVNDPNFSGKVKISAGNTKMGTIPSVSMLPFLTCPARCANTCGPECYAAKLANMRTNVRKAWAYNTALAMLRPEVYWTGVFEVLAVSRFFRFHVSGDIPNMAYLKKMIEGALKYPHCDILAFTARFEIVNAWIAENGDLPQNLHIEFSGFHGRETLNINKLPETRVIYKGETPETKWKACGGNCLHCASNNVGCWNSKKGETIYFKKH